MQIFIEMFHKNNKYMSRKNKSKGCKKEWVNEPYLTRKSPISRCGYQELSLILSRQCCHAVSTA
jgi:hypothetical protein